MKWVSVKERMPELPGEGYPVQRSVIASDGEQSFYRVYERALARGKTVTRWLYPWGAVSDENIIQWMPLPEGEEVEWISVKERMPELPGEGYSAQQGVIASNGEQSFFRIYERALVRGKTVTRWSYPWGNISDESIIQWIPLPEPQKETDDE